MDDQQLLKHITLDPEVMTGKPVIKGTRLTVEYIANLLAHGATDQLGMFPASGRMIPEIEDEGFRGRQRSCCSLTAP